MTDCPLCHQLLPEGVSEIWIRDWLCEVAFTVRMTKAQHIVYTALLDAKGAIVSYDVLIENLWPIDADQPDTWGDVIKNHVWRLRKILKGTPFYIEVIKGRGYRLVGSRDKA